MKKMATAIASAVMVFGITGAGASLLSLTGSDSAPGSAKTEAACVNGSLVVTNPVITGQESGNKIHTVTVAVSAGGDLEKCMGQTMLVEVALSSGPPSRAFGVYTFATDSVTSITFGFNGVSTPDAYFLDTAPTVTDGVLVEAAAGTKVEPVKAKDFGQTDITIAKTWGTSS